MSVLNAKTPSTSDEGGDIVHSVLQLPEAVVEVTTFEVEYGGDCWHRVRRRVQGINRTDED